MTLNDHFALKSVLGSASNGLVCSGFQTKLFGNLQSYVRIHCQRQKCSIGTLISGVVRFVKLFTGVLWRRSVKPNCIHTSRAVHWCLENTLYTRISMLEV